jgi:hypothetical protein
MTKMRREMLLKLAKSQNSDRPLPIGWKNCQYIGDKTIEFKFDLRENSLAELDTIHVSELLQFSIDAKKNKLTFIPQFNSLRRSNAELSISVLKYPICLRDVLNDRSQIHKLAKPLIKALLQAYMAIDQEDILMRGIHPYAIYLTRDLKTAMFSDIRSMSSGTCARPINSSLRAPYNGQGFSHIS